MRILILGNVAVESGTDTEVVAALRQRQLLVLLALHQGDAVSEERITEALWPPGEELPANLRGTIQTHVSRLRGIVGQDAIRTDPAGYVLQEGIAVDAHQAEALVRRASNGSLDDDAITDLERALSMWTGPSLGDLADDEYARMDALRLDELRLLAAEELSDRRLNQGLAAEVVPGLEQLVAAHPLRERAWQLLMTALYRSGRHAEALRAYERYRTTLAEETGLEPSPELLDLQRMMLDHDPRLQIEAKRQSISGYELGERIGEGAFGTIFRAVQPAVGREVAVKVVRSDLANDPGFVRRFEVEAQTIARLEHPHIVPLYDFWRDSQGAYLVMRYLPGGSADQLLVRDGPLPLDHVSQLVDEVGGALVLAHSEGVVHRDVKPGNILFDSAGHAYLGDFGIASAAGPATAVGLQSAGSPLYAAPEQLRDGQASVSSDIYALGVVLYEMLSGAAPFCDAVSVNELLERKLTSTVPSLREHRSDVPAPVDEVIRAATAQRPTDRFESMAELVVAYRAATQVAAPGAATTGGHPVASSPRREMINTLISVQADAVNPYRGLDAFTEADVADFHGRSEVAEELAAKVTRSRFIAVVGPSGSGKSSVVRAGLTPLLRERDTYIATMVPGINPLREASTAISQVATSASPEVLTTLQLGERGLLDAANSMLPDGNSELILVIDQFEELFILSDETERDALLSLLKTAASDPSSRVRIVATLRADFYDRPLQSPEISELIRANTVALSPMDATGIEAAIRRPAERLGVAVEPALVVELVGEVTKEPSSLPLMQYVLTELFDRRTAASMTLATYRSMNGLSGAIAARADRLANDLGLDGVRRLFLRLVSPGDGTGDTRRRVLRSELSHTSESVIDAFGAARLLTFDHEPTSREPTVEVAHEAILREWPRLREWLDEDRDALRLLRHLGAAAKSWEASDRDVGELYSGGRLEAAIDLAAAHPTDLTPIEQEFVAESARVVDERASREHRASRRIRVSLLISLLLLTAAVVAGLLAQRRATEARNAEEAAGVAERQALASAGLAREAQRTVEIDRLIASHDANLAADRELSALLALEAHRLQPDPQTEAHVLSFALAQPSPLSITRLAESVRIAEFSRNGRWLVHAVGGSAHVFDTASGTPVGQPIEIAASVSEVAIADDGKRLVTLDTAAREISVYALPTGDLTAQREPAFFPASLAISTNAEVVGYGSDAFSGEALGGMEAWRVDTDEVTFHLGKETGGWLHMALSADGHDALNGGPQYFSRWQVSDQSNGALHIHDPYFGHSAEVSSALRAAGVPDSPRSFADLEDVRILEDSGFVSFYSDGSSIGWREGVQREAPGATLAAELSGRDLDLDRPVIFATWGPIAGPRSGELAAIAVEDDAGLIAVASSSGSFHVIDFSLGEVVAGPIDTDGAPIVTMAFADGASLNVVDANGLLTSWALNGLGATSLSFDFADTLTPTGGVAWRTSGGEVTDGRTGVAVDPHDEFAVVGDVLILGRVDGVCRYPVGPCRHQLEGYDTLSGERLWRTTYAGDGATHLFEAAPGFGSFLLGTRAGWVQHRDARTGSVIYSAKDLAQDRMAPTLDASVQTLGTAEGAFAALTGNGNLGVWHVDHDAMTLRTSTQAVGGTAVALIDDTHLAVGFDDGRVEIRSSTNLDGIQAVVAAHGSTVREMVWAPSHRMLVTSDDRETKLWRIEPLALLATLEDFRRPRVGEDGRLYLSPVAGGPAASFDISVQGALSAVCDITSRNLTEAEWDEYLPEDEPYRETCPR